MFERQVRATPDAHALSAGSGERYTYAELHAGASRLAGELAAHGVGPETVVALVLPRSTRSIVAILAVLAAGGAYLPVDITLPGARIESILTQANPVLALTATGHSELVEAGIPTLHIDDPVVAERISRRPVAAPAVQRHPDQCAYVIFTSGSTGEPKGVIGTNAAVLSYFADHRERVYRASAARLGRPLRIAHAWSLSFDASWQPMVGLLDGHGIHLFDAEEMRDADRLVEGIAAHRIDMIDTTPSMFGQLRAAGLLEHGLSVLALGGEAIDSALWQHLRALPHTAVYNCYGPTEMTVEAVVAPVKRVPGADDRHGERWNLRLCPGFRVADWCPTVWWVSFTCLARSWPAAMSVKPAMTAARFVADPFARDSACTAPVTWCVACRTVDTPTWDAPTPR